jgi:arylmalonate decarboxylase
MGSRIVGLVVPEAAGVIPTEAAVMYPNLTFVAHGIGLQSLSPAGYDEAIERVIPAAQWLAARGAQAIMVIGTSLTFYRGAAFNRALTERLSAETALPAATMSGAIVEGLETVGARNVAVVTAYSDEVNGMLVAFLQQSGFAVLSLRTVNVANRVGEAAQTAEDDILRASVDACREAATADGVLIVCGGLRTLNITPRIEARCGVPVVSSMPAALRMAARLAGAPAPIPGGYGRLLSGELRSAVP